MNITPNEIMLIVCRVTGEPIADLLGKGRHKSTVRARRVYVALCRAFTEASYPDITETMGRRRTGHSTAQTANAAFWREHDRGDAATVEVYTRCWLEVRKAQANKAVRVLGKVKEEAA